MNEPVIVKLELPASHRFLNILSGVIAEMINRIEQVEDRENVIYQLQLAAQEVAANIVDHAYPDVEDERIGIRLEFDPSIGELWLIFIDTGISFDEAGQADAPMVEPSDGGMGLYIVSQTVDGISYLREQEQNFWKITKRLMQVES